MPRNGSTRRDALKLVGTAAGAASLSGIATAAPGEDGESVEVNIGWANERGRSTAKDADGEVVREFGFDAMTKRMPEPAIEGLRNNPNIRYVEENGTMEALAQTTPWGIDRTDSEVAHANDSTGAGADVAIIDTGVDDDHPDLEGNVGEGRAFATCGTGGTFGGCFVSGNSNDCNEDWSDDNDHGTHCAGTASAINNDEGVVGVSTQATIHP
ncbi:MAG: S8 family serine peptidase, partial [Halolamina sp.]